MVMYVCIVVMSQFEDLHGTVLSPHKQGRDASELAGVLEEGAAHIWLPL